MNFAKLLTCLAALSLLTSCAAVKTIEYQGAAYAKSAEDNNIIAWYFDACATPLSAIVRNSQQIPGLVNALVALCLPNGDANIAKQLEKMHK